MKRPFHILALFASFFITLLALFLFLQTPTKKEATDLNTEDHNNTFVFFLYSETPPKTCQQSISSILKQTYTNYRIILAETPNLVTYTPLIKTLVAKENKTELLTIVSLNKEASLTDAFSYLKEDEIVIQLNCNDWLFDEHVLEKLNEIYQKEETWLTYSQYLEYPSYQKAVLDPYLKKLLRNRHTKKLPWLTSPLKTYPAKLLKKLSPKDPHASLEAYLEPLAEYSKNHTRFIDETLSIHNTAN